MEYIDPEENQKKYKIKPGCFTIVSTTGGVILEKFELKLKFFKFSKIKHQSFSSVINDANLK